MSLLSLILWFGSIHSFNHEIFITSPTTLTPRRFDRRTNRDIMASTLQLLSGLFWKFLVPIAAIAILTVLVRVCLEPMFTIELVQD